MTLQNKVVALREFFGLTSAPLLAAIAEMNVIMELPSEGSLLGQVDKLVSKTGVVPASTTPVVLPAQVSPVVLPAQVSPAAAQTPPLLPRRQRHHVLAASASSTRRRRAS